jgi:uncharacterized protein involved in exopolysaccharide biosynthesis
VDRRSALVVLGVAAIGSAAGALYVVAASDRYEARGELLVTPAQSESALDGIGLLEDSDESAAADTAARIVESGAVASAVATRLRIGADETRDAVDAHRVDDSNVVAKPEPEPSAAPGGYALDRLEAIAADRRRTDPAAADELDTYVHSLRSHASEDGSVPRSFDALIEGVFGEAPS